MMSDRLAEALILIIVLMGTLQYIGLYLLSQAIREAEC